jgi:hypothetical protein
MSTVGFTIFFIISVFLVVFIFLIFIGIFAPSSHSIRQFFEFNEMRPLYAARVFWVFILIPIFVSLWLALPLFDGFMFVRSYEGYDNFTKRFSFPIYILSGSILFGVVIGRFHASKQRAASLVLTEVNNNFSNFFEHKRMFFEVLDFKKIEILSLGQELLFNISIDKEILYENLFPKNSLTKFDVLCAPNKKQSHIDIVKLEFGKITFAHSFYRKNIVSHGINERSFNELKAKCKKFKEMYGVSLSINSPNRRLLSNLLLENPNKFNKMIDKTLIEALCLILTSCRALANFSNSAEYTAPSTSGLIMIVIPEDNVAQSK